MALRLCELLEFKSSRVRREANGAIVIEGVKLLGERSVNVNADGTRNVYTPEARASAIPLYEGAKVFADHPPRATPGAERSMRDQVGRVRNAKALPDGNYGELWLNPKHPLAESIAWDAEHAPDSLGMSHNAVGEGRVEGSNRVITAITRVRSNDVVCAAATTTSLFESAEDATVDKNALLKSHIAGVADLVEGLDDNALGQLVDILATDSYSGDKIAKALAFLTRAALRAVPATATLTTESAIDPALAKAQKDLAEARAELDGAKAAAAKREQLAKREAMLVESRLPAEARTDVFASLVREAATDDAAKALIEDRKRLVFHQTPTTGAGSAPARTETKSVDDFVSAL